MNRRDKCYLAGKRAGKLSEREAAIAWWYLSGRLEGLGQRDVPKFVDLIRSIRKATIAGKRARRETEQELTERTE